MAMSEESAPQSPRIVLPHSGCRKLIAYRKSEVIYLGTVVFCRRFLPAHGDRTVDQMKQAARSCKQNIVEGSASSGTSKETEIKLTNVARSSLEELIEDYRDYLNVNQLVIWSMDDAKAQAAREFARSHNDWPDWKQIFETRSADALANLMLIVCCQERYMLGKMVAKQEAELRQYGDIRERIRAVGSVVRCEDLGKSIFAQLAEAKTVEELQAKAKLWHGTVDQAVRSIENKRAWV